MIGLGSYLSFKGEQIFKVGRIVRPRVESTSETFGDE